MHILLTRPLEDSKELILRFSSLGHNVSHLPVIKIEPIKYDEPDYSQFKGVIFTSSNAIKNLDLTKVDKKIECYCVGSATEKVLINYTVSATQEIKEEFRAELKKSIPDIIYVYSENSAKSLLNLLKKYDLLDSWMDTNLMCMGEKSSSILNEIKWKKIFLFNPGEEEFLLYKI